MNVRVNPATFASEARQVGSAARSVRSSTTAFGNIIGGYAGMAGIDPMAEDFAQGSPEEGGYDLGARSIMRSGVTVAQAMLEQGVI